MSMNDQVAAPNSSPQRRAGVGRRIAKAGLFLLWNVVIIVVLLEIICRVGIITNPAYERRQKLRSATGSFKVMILGDSFTVDRGGTACQLLADDLRKRGFGVLNMGREGFGPGNYLDALETQGPDYAPDLILVNYYAGNDLTDTLFGQAKDNSRRDRIKRIVNVLYVGELILQIRARLAQSARLASTQQVIQESGGRLDSTLSPFLVELARFYPDYLITNLLMENEDAARAWASNQAYLLRLKQIAKKLGSRLVIAGFPSTVQVSESHKDFYTNIGFRYDARLATTRESQDRLASWCQREAITFIDLLPEFRSAQPREFYLPTDDHWNSDGNVFAYQVLRDHLAAEKAIPESAGKTAVPALPVAGRTE